MMVKPEFAIAVGAFTAAAAVVDIRLHRIPNYLTVPAAVLGLLYHMILGENAPMSGLTSLAGFAVGFSLLLLPWLLGGGGMGDVKLLAALGSWLGPLWILVAFGASAFMAAAIAVGMMFYSTLTKGVTATKRQYMANASKGRKKPKRVLPFAVPVALSTWLMLLWFVVGT